MAEFVFLPAILLGLIIGLYEAILMHRDVKVPTHRFGHTIHALIFAVIAVFAVMNVEFVFSILPFLQNIPAIGNVLVFRIAIGLIAMIKIHGVSAAIKSTACSRRRPLMCLPKSLYDTNLISMCGNKRFSTMLAIASELASPFAFTFAISTNKSAVTDSNSCLGERSSLAKAVAVNTIPAD